ncbi:SseB family protein [Parafrankia elaeagni]|uniref:SseB family protein n=1 Tax=Parafrankia elaeagni TaxID=222534 RepID=UPI00037DDCD1|nr:SseB family protein [Parafrankia elaeagni]
MSPDLLTPPGQGDDGRADSALLTALRSGDRSALTAALPGARVFVGVEARSLATDVVTGADKQSDMVLVTLRTPSGSGALPVFSAVDVMAAWRPSVRPVAVTLPDACAEAVRMGLAAVVIDLGGPAPVTLDVRPTAGEGSGGAGCRIPRPFGRGEGMWISSSATDGVGAARGRGVTRAVAMSGADGLDEVVVADDTGGGLLRPRPVPLGARGRRRIRAALAGLPAATEVWPAELAPPAGREQAARPVLAVAVSGVAAGAAGSAAVDGVDTVDGVDEATAEIVRRLRLVIEAPVVRGAATGADDGQGSDETVAAVLVVDPTEVPAVRAHLGRGVRPPRRFALWRPGAR